MKKIKTFKTNLRRYIVEIEETYLENNKLRISGQISYDETFLVFNHIVHLSICNYNNVFLDTLVMREIDKIEDWKVVE